MKRSGPLKRTTPLKRGPGPQRKTRLSPMSDKRRKVSVARREFVAEVLSHRTRCEAGSVIRSVDTDHRCFGYSTDVHEVLTRARGGDILDPDNVRAICRRCHDWIHDHPADSLDLGLLAVRHPEADSDDD